MKEKSQDLRTESSRVDLAMDDAIEDAEIGALCDMAHSRSSGVFGSLPERRNYVEGSCLEVGLGPAFCLVSRSRPRRLMGIPKDCGN